MRMKYPYKVLSMKNDKSLFLVPEQFNKTAKYVNTQFLSQPFRGVNVGKRDTNQRAIVLLCDGTIVYITRENAKKYIDFGSLPHKKLKNVHTDLKIKIEQIEKDYNSPVLKIIHRPNHGLYHSIRASAVIPVIYQHNEKNLFKKDPQILKLTQKELANLQNMMLFSVIGREDETGFSDSSEESDWRYQMFRAQSGTEYLEYCLDHNHYTSNEREAYLDALVVELMGYPRLPVIDKENKTPDPFPKIADKIIKKYGSLYFTLEERVKCEAKLKMMNSAHGLELIRCYAYQSNKNPRAENLNHGIVTGEMIGSFNKDLYNPLENEYLPYHKAFDLLLFVARLQNKTGERKRTFVETKEDKIDQAIEKSKILEKKLYTEFFVDALNNIDKLKELYNKAIGDPVFHNHFKADNLVYFEDKKNLIKWYDFELNYQTNKENLFEFIKEIAPLIDKKSKFDTIKDNKVKLKEIYENLFSSELIELYFVKSEMESRLIRDPNLYPLFYKSDDQDHSTMENIIRNYYLAKIGSAFEKSIMSNPKDRTHLSYSSNLFNYISPIVDENLNPVQRNTDREVDLVTCELNSVERPKFFKSTAQTATSQFQVDDLPTLLCSDIDSNKNVTIQINDRQKAFYIQMILRDLNVISRDEHFEECHINSKFYVKVNQDKLPIIYSKLIFNRVQIPKNHSTCDTFFNDQGEIVALNLIKQTKAVVRVLSSYDHHKKGVPDYTYIMDQVEDPIFNRPVKGKTKDVTKKAILRTGNIQLFKNRNPINTAVLDHQFPINQNPPLTQYWDKSGQPIDEGYNHPRGAPKNTVFAKKESFSLLDPIGKMILYPGQFNPKDGISTTFFPIGFLSNIDDMHTHGERYIFSANTSTNKRFWLGIDSISDIKTHLKTNEHRLKSKRLIQLQKELNQAAQDRDTQANLPPLVWNELLLGCSKQSIQSLFVPGTSEIRFFNDKSKISYEFTAKPSTIIYRLNVVHHALNLKKDYGYDLPILIIDGVNAPKLYTEDLLKQDILRILDLIATGNFPYMDKKDKTYQEELILNFFNRFTKTPYQSLEDLNTIVADKSYIKTILKTVKLMGGDFYEHTYIYDRRNYSKKLKKEVCLRQFRLNKPHFIRLIIDKKLLSVNDIFEDHYDDTPLHLACRLGDAKLVKHLVNRYQPTLLENKKGETPLTIAQNNGLSSIEQILLSLNNKTLHAESTLCKNSIEEQFSQRFFNYISNNDVSGFKDTFSEYLSKVKANKCKVIDFNQLGHSKESALNLAAKTNHTAMFIYLLSIDHTQIEMASKTFGFSNFAKIELKHDKVFDEAFKHDNLRILENLIVHNGKSDSVISLALSKWTNSTKLIGDFINLNQRNGLHLYALSDKGYVRKAVEKICKSDKLFSNVFSSQALLQEDKFKCTPIMLSTLVGNTSAIDILGKRMKLTQWQINLYTKISRDPLSQINILSKTKMSNALPGFNADLDIKAISNEIDIYTPIVNPTRSTARNKLK